MQCQNCNSPATVHVTDLVKKEMTHLCSECAAQRDSVEDSETELQGLLAHFFKANAGEEKNRDEQAPACPFCGTTYAEFRKIGRFGCPEDYDVFRDRLEPLLARIHDAELHVGKRPRLGERSKTIADLTRQLGAAVSEENYETAARLRDLIREQRGTEGP